MPVVLPSEDFAFLTRVRDLGLSGLTQAQIAEQMGMTLGTLRFRLSSLGFEFMPANDLRTTLTKQSWREADVSPDSPAPAAEPAGV